MFLKHSITLFFRIESDVAPLTYLNADSRTFLAVILLDKPTFTSSSEKMKSLTTQTSYGLIISFKSE